MATPDAAAGPESTPPGVPAPELAPEAAPEAEERTKVAMPVYVPEGYVLRKVAERRPVAAPAPRRRSGSFVLGITLTLVAGMLVGYLGGFAVARRTGDASVTVTVHGSAHP